MLDSNCAAVEELDGDFHIRELARITGVSRRQVENLAPVWERQQLLTPAGYDDGRRTPRRVTPKLRGLVETGG